MPDSCIKVEVLRVEQCNGIIQPRSQPTTVAMTTKFSHVATTVRRGATENAGLENDGPSKSRGGKCRTGISLNKARAYIM